ncbi:response regulator [Pollutimonas thiosulfatoxidans]|uniref:Two-component system response regulator n=1 Tax=Pollutimonas thiosulfatoxidans TaxID=2028345 RepID=A0A410GFT5_9BURK|nr:response regulator [Pollutimonas thiosulfatoxidans]MBF6618332.1 response regulator [Candidimonas sp.]NYT45223.1 response regulator [Alcaligenaceae bacterium]QAA95163.1 two-component system response regulator [Pollutimonas thiosulfatoxidans]
MARILVVDDEIGIRELLSEILYDEGHTVELAENAAQARAARLRARPDLVLLDIWMPDTDGVSLLKEWGAQGLLDMPVIMMSGHATVDTAVEATRIGAVDFLEKPITLQKLLKTIAAGLARPVITPALAAAARMPDRRNDQAQPLTTGPIPDLPAPVVDRNHSLLGSITLDQPLRDARDEFERIYFEYHLGRENHSMTRVSEKTGLERTHLYRKLKQLGIDSSRKRNAS